MILVRKVRNGRVKINGVWFKPHIKLGRPVPYHFEGMWLAFVTYDPVCWNDKPFVSLWGTKLMAETKTETDFHKACTASLHILTLRNYYIWSWWVQCHDTH